MMHGCLLSLGHWTMEFHHEEVLGIMVSMLNFDVLV